MGRIAAAIAIASVVAGVFGVPLTADAGSAAIAGSATVSVDAAVVASASVEATSSSSTESTVTTPTLDWTIGPALAAASVATTVTPVRPRRTVRQIIADTGKKAGLSKSEIAGLMWLAYRESRFHPTSKSKSGCYGLFQLSAGMAKGKPWKDPEWNTKRAIRYMKGRYGGVLQAKAFWQRHHWY